MKTFLTYTAGLIVVYLAVSHATGLGQILTAGGNTYIGGVKTLQGR